MTETSVVERVETATPVPVSDTHALMSMIERVALNPAIDIDKFERLMSLLERTKANEAKRSYAAAFAEMQSELPIIPERGHIVVREKDKNGSRTGDVQQDTSYALWEDINEEIKPVLSKYRFGLSFRTGQTPEGRVTVTAILRHAEGHEEETTMVLQHDSTGSKNAVQAIGSSTSYGKRYAATAILNLTSRGDDDDGAEATKPLPKAQAREPYADMQAEIDACFTVEELANLWKSRQFQIEFERLPLDWKSLITQRKDERKVELTPKATVPPNFDGFPGDRPR